MYVSSAAQKLPKSPRPSKKTLRLDRSICAPAIIGVKIKATAAQDIATLIEQKLQYEAQAGQFKTLYLK
ncbi:MAG: hypothetical protein BVN30_06115 [Proteobacteria bacterium ST_bin16]|nr:MAG: hypothetical protein BVN30_06115 [Proteobacteria bacterium ST_bin16]